MPDRKIPQGYQGTYAKNANGSATLVTVSRNISIAENKSNKEHIGMAENQNGNGTQFVPYTTEQKKEYAKQFTPGERRSYRKGQQSAYSHVSNISKREANFIYGNLQRDAAQPPAATAQKPASGRKKKNDNK